MRITTDVTASALGEFYFKFKRKYSNIAYITIGTGIGIGLILNGKPYYGNLHSEGGHMIVNKIKKDKNFEGVCNFHKNCYEGFCTNYSISKRLNIGINYLKNLHEDLEI